jgi:hypothetical protein
MTWKTPHQPSPIKTSMEINRTTRHEQVSAMLWSLLLLVGVITTGMFLAWMSASIVWNRPIVQVNVEDVGGGSFGDNRTGKEKELVEPGVEELREVAVTERVDPVLGSITSLVSIEAVTSGEEDSVDLWSRQKVGSDGPGDVVGTPAWGRWEIKFSSSDINLYAQQLDFFKVELGVAGGGIDVVDYCSNFSSATANRRVGAPKDEKRLFFLYKSGSLRDADRTLASKAGIEVSDRVVFQFYQPDMYRQLLKLENERMGNRRVSEVLKTTFGVRGTPGKWEFFVLDQKYRAPLPYKS